MTVHTERCTKRSWVWAPLGKLSLRKWFLSCNDAEAKGWQTKIIVCAEPWGRKDLARMWGFESQGQSGTSRELGGARCFSVESCHRKRIAFEGLEAEEWWHRFPAVINTCPSIFLSLFLSCLYCSRESRAQVSVSRPNSYCLLFAGCSSYPLSVVTICYHSKPSFLLKFPTPIVIIY